MKAWRALALCSLAATALWVWYPVLGKGFVSDTFLLPVLFGPGGEVDWAGVLSEWWRPWLGMTEAATRRPVVTAHFALDLWLFGARPLGFHLSNMVCHLGSGLIVFALIRRVAPGGGLFAAWIGAFVYLVHPARAEAVAWVVGRVDGTAALLAHAAALAFLVSGERRGVPGFLSGLLSLVLALGAYGAKEMALALPASLLFLRWLAAARVRPPRMLLALHLALFALVVLWRVHLLGGVGGDRQVGALALGYASGLPGKLVAAFMPDGPGEPWLRFLAWVVLPLAAGWVRGPRSLRAAWCLGWWALLLIPAALVEIHADGSGTRQLLMPALAGGVMLAVLLGRPSRSRNLWPGNAVRWAGGGALCALAVLGTRERIEDWREAAGLADQAREALAARPRGPGEGPLAIAPLPIRPQGRVQPFRIDCAFLAFRTPFAPEDQETLVLHNALEWPDIGPLHQASVFCREVLAWQPDPGGFLDLKGGGRMDEAVDLDALVVDPAAGRRGLEGWAIAGGAEWTWIGIPASTRPTAFFEGLDLELAAPSPEFEVVLAWAAPSDADEFSAPGKCPVSLGPHRHARFHPLDGGRASWRSAVGNQAGFFVLGRPGALALAIRGQARLLSLTWKGRLPRAGWGPGAGTVVDLGSPSLPVPSGFRGACRLVVLTPVQVIEVLFQGKGQLEQPLGPEARRVLSFLARVAPGASVYYYIDRLAAPGARHATLERTHVFAARLAGL